MLMSIRNLREISRRCLTGEQLDQELLYWLGESLNRFLERLDPSLDQAFGLKFARGGVPWWMEEAILKRDAALRELADNCFSDLRASELVRSVRTSSRRYESCAWLYDREQVEMPRGYAGTPKEYLWLAFKSGAAMPLSERRLRNILAT